ncbi:hypothetical protein L1049_011475 [Liquidambar formosana]|uniref:KIB1-4 beta-propeller domain-containing protein n=1 Tax=Liquidambar formosana TaxID=63359 RepID=A0AAP0WX24_LIQFO
MAIAVRTMMKFFSRQEFMRKTTTPIGLRHTSPSSRGSPEFLLPCQRLVRPPPLGSTFLKGQPFTMLFGRSVRFSSSSSSSSFLEVEEMTSPPSALVSSGLHPCSPWLMLPPELDTATGEEFDCFYSLLDKQVVKLNRKQCLRVPDGATCFGSSRGWLGFVDPKDCSLYLSNPFSLLPHQQPHSPRVIQLPPIETLPLVVGTVRNPESNVIEKLHVNLRDDTSDTSDSDDEIETLPLVVGTVRNPESNVIEKLHVNLGDDTSDTSDSDDEKFCIIPIDLVSFHIKIQNLALSSDPSNEEEDCLLLAEYGDPGKFAFCRPGRDTAWTALDGPGPTFSQFAYSKKENLFYSLFGREGIQAWDVSNPCTPAKRTTILPERQSRVVKNGFFMQQYLVVDESLGGVLLVNRHCARFSVAVDGTFIDKDPNDPWARFIPEDHALLDTLPPYKTLGFDVYKLNCAEKKMECIKCLGDRAIFLGLNSNSFSLSTCEFPGLRPNSIYFTDCYFEPMLYGQYPGGGSDLGTFNLEDNSIMRCCEDLKKRQMETSLRWIAPANSC